MAKAKEFVLETIQSNETPRMGLEIYFSRFLAEEVGDGTHSVSTVRLPKTPAERDQAIKWAHDPAVAYSYRDDDKLVFVKIGMVHGWLEVFKRAGIVVRGTGKAIKRLKAFNRPASLGAKLDHLNVMVVDDLAYTSEDITENGDRLLDGMFGIAPHIMDELIRQSEFHEDPFRATLQRNRARRAKAYNVRIVFEGGLIKGNAARAMQLPDGVDIICARSAIKEEITSNRNIFILAEPQEMGYSVRTNKQTMINLPKLFRQADMEQWIRDYIATAKSDIEAGIIMPSFSDVEARRWRMWKDYGMVQEGFQAAAEYSIIEYLVRKGDVTTSPSMLESYAKSQVQNLINNGNARVPVPCAVHGQTISESMATMLGHFIKVSRGTERFLPELEMFVVNDLDWIYNYENGGGYDQDDMWDKFFRTMDGVKKIISVRSPNGKGEYFINDYVEGDYFPVWTKENGTEVSFPEVNGKGWPKQVTVALADGSLTYRGLPSQLLGKAQVDTEFYSIDTFTNDVIDSLKGGSVGIYINARMLWDMTFPGLRRVHLCSMEDAIDAFTQGGSQADRDAITNEAYALIKECVESGRVIDSHFWKLGGFQRNVEKGTVVNLGDGILSRTHKMLEGHIHAYIGYYDTILREKIPGWIQKHAQTTVKLPGKDNRLLHLGGQQASLVTKFHRKGDQLILAPYYQEAASLLRQYRNEVGKSYKRASDAAIHAEMNGYAITPGLSDREWMRLYKPTMDAIMAKPEGVERDTLCMALVAASYLVRKKDGTLNDNLCFNNKHTIDETTNERVPQGPFPFVMTALRKYGVVADQVDVDDDGHLVQEFIEEWHLVCKRCGKEGDVTSARTYQIHLLHGELCGECYSKQ